MATKKKQSQNKLLKQRRRGPLFDEDELRDATSDFIFERRERYAPKIVSTLVRDLRSQLVKGIEAGDRVGDLKNRVRRVLVNEAPSRIERIVRTEVNAGMNAGALASYKASKLVSRKKWLTAGDPLVRGNRAGDQFSHRLAHGQVVQVNAPFIVSGERLQHPGDPRGSAGNIIRCRCTTVPVLVGQRLPRPAPVVVPAAPPPDAPPKPVPAPPRGRGVAPRPPKPRQPFPVQAGPGQPRLPGFTETIPSIPDPALPGSVPQGIAPGKPAAVLTAVTPTEGSLINSPAISKKNLGGGANASQIHTLQDGSKGVFKSKRGEVRLRSSIEKGTYYRREAAAYDVSKVMGVDDLVPATVQRTDNLTGEVGSLQEFVPGKVAKDMLDPYDGRKDLGRAAAYDYAIGQTDRHKGNWLIAESGPRKGKFVLIDNGLSFPKDNASLDALYSKSIILRAESGNLPIPQKEVREWRDKWNDIEAALVKNGIEREAIDEMRNRIDTLAEMGDFRELVQFDPALRRGRGNF